MFFFFVLKARYVQSHVGIVIWFFNLTKIISVSFEMKFRYRTLFQQKITGLYFRNHKRSLLFFTTLEQFFLLCSALERNLGAKPVFGVVPISAILTCAVAMSVLSSCVVSISNVLSHKYPCVAPMSRFSSYVMPRSGVSSSMLPISKSAIFRT